MNKLIILCGMVFLGITSTPQSNETEQISVQGEMVPVTLKVRIDHEKGDRFFTAPEACEESDSETELDLSAIAYEELEESENLGFDTREYLPENFNPYETYVDLNAIAFLEEREEDLIPGILKGLLPRDFDPYGAPADFMDVSYMENEDLALGFNTSRWLPEGFDAYSRELDLDSIVYIEEDTIDLGFDTSGFLPENFDPYSL
jgi:hypothetical protein